TYSARSAESSEGTLGRASSPQRVPTVILLVCHGCMLHAIWVGWFRRPQNLRRLSGAPRVRSRNQGSRWCSAGFDCAATPLRSTGGGVSALRTPFNRRRLNRRGSTDVGEQVDTEAALLVERG